MAASASGAWSGRGDSIAGWDGYQWTFVTPAAEMRVFDKGVGCARFYRDGWSTAPDPGLPQGGATVDAEARDAISGIVEVLKHAGLISS